MNFSPEENNLSLKLGGLNLSNIKSSIQITGTASVTSVFGWNLVKKRKNKTSLTLTLQHPLKKGILANS